MKKIKIITIPIVVLITLISVSSVFATAKPSSAVYGVGNETYPGAVIDGSGDNGIKLYWWYNIETASIVSSAGDEAPEGNKYTRYTFKAATGALGYTCDSLRVIDMSNYSGGKIKFSARSKYATRLKSSRVGFQIKIGEYIESGVTKASTYDKFYEGILSNPTNELTDEWKEFEIDIPNNATLKAEVKDRKGVEKGLEDVYSLFVFLDGNDTIDKTGDTIDIDNIRWERADGTFEEIDVTGINFSAELKNGSGDKITWYANGTKIDDIKDVDWKIANEYINLKITKFLDKDNNEYPIGNGKTVSSYPFSSSSLSKWKFRIYTSSGTAKRDGLLPYENGSYYEDIDPLPLCWRLVDSELKNFVIKETDDHAHLYEGDNDQWYCWLYIQNRGSDDYNKGDYAIMWNNSNGYRGSEGDYYVGSTGNGFDIMPKLYIGAKFKNAAAGVKYESIIVIECYDE